MEFGNIIGEIKHTASPAGRASDPSQGFLWCLDHLLLEKAGQADSTHSHADGAPQSTHHALWFSEERGCVARSLFHFFTVASVLRVT